MHTSNPALGEKTFQLDKMGDTSVMSVQGTVLKTGLLLTLLGITGAITWIQSAANPQLTMGFVIGGAIVGLIIALITIFHPTVSPYTAPVYAVAEGVFLGAISAFFNAQYPGIALQAVMLTFGTLAVMLLAYSSGLIKVTEKFKLGIVAATGAICLVYLVSIVMNMFGSGVPYIHGNGMIGIGFSLVVVVIAALNLVLDFDLISKGASQGAPKYMEWYGAFALLVTLVWLYLEILRLLAKLRGRD